MKKVKKWDGQQIIELEGPTSDVDMIEIQRKFSDIKQNYMKDVQIKMFKIQKRQQVRGFFS